jgi:hypothetical protein
MAVDKFSNAAGPQHGLIKIVPTSITVGSGSGSSDGNGNIVFSGASSITINGCFSSNYENYKIFHYGLQNTAYGTHSLQFTIGGTVTGAANFGYQGFASFQANSTAVVWTDGATTNNAAAYGANGANAGNKFSQVTEILQPALADATFLHTLAWSQGTGAGTNTSSFTNGWNSYTGAGFDGFRITASSGTMTGKFRIYGYNN